MLGRVQPRRCVELLFVLLFTTTAFAQFTSGVQGSVQDPSGAGVPKATVHLVNVATNVTQETTTDSAGNFGFFSIAPGSYQVIVEAAGFSKTQADITLLDRADVERADHPQDRFGNRGDHRYHRGSGG